MQLREEIRSTSNTHECPINDWMCRFFDNGSCKLVNAEDKCDLLKKLHDSGKHKKILL